MTVAIFIDHNIGFKATTKVIAMLTERGRKGLTTFTGAVNVQDKALFTVNDTK